MEENRRLNGGQVHNFMIFRTDNCVKNYFYSSMKKSIRRLSLIIRLSHLKNVKSLKPSDICIILDAFDTKFRGKITNWS